jgi:phosphatidate cytidylyltransferase
VASGLRQRIATALLLAGVVVTVLLAMPASAAVAVVAVVILAGAWEWAGFAGCVTGAARIGYAAAVGVAVFAAWRVTADAARLAEFLCASALWWLVGFLWVVFAPGRGGRLAAAAAGFVVLVPAAIGLGRLALVQPDGQLLLLFLVVLIAAADIGAYFGGRSFGRHKLAPSVSPGKTWEGLVAGMAGAGVAALFGATFFDVPARAWIAACVAVALLSVVGDLLESMFKRRAGLKDSGGLLPGHGGVLDRIDSLTAAGPVFLLALQLLGVAA